VQLLGPFDTLGFQPLGIPNPTCGPPGPDGECSSCDMTVQAKFQECHTVMTCRICVPLPRVSTRLLGSMSELQQPEQQQQQQQQQEEEDDTVGDVGCCRRCRTCLGGSTRGLQATPGNGTGKGEMAPKIQQATKTGKGGTASNTGVVVAAESSGKGKGKGADCVSTTTTTGGKGGQGNTLGKGGKGGDGVTTTTATAMSASKNGKGGKGDTTLGSSSTCLEAGDDSTAPSVAPSRSTVRCPAHVVVHPVLCLSCLDVVPENSVCTTAIPVPVV
jgi:hypothetical protein